jgi:DNA (cytosine-5)-methyltransferase 1
MEFWAHQTLSLRSFFHQFPDGGAPEEYYAHLRGEITRRELLEAYPAEAVASNRSAWHAELGVAKTAEVDGRIREAISGHDPWVLCGGPPCQAFSIVGRSRTGGISEEDGRVYLYHQYLRILSVHEPPIFIMENVKGLLSSQIKGNKIFRQMLTDLRYPGGVVRTFRKSGARYSLYSLVAKEGMAHQPEEPGDFVVRCEDYGIPQSRHRIIILGVREDINRQTPPALHPYGAPVSTRSVLSGLPKLRSGLSRSEDGQAAWLKTLHGIRESAFMKSRRSGDEQLLRERVLSVLNGGRGFRADRGGEFLACQAGVEFKPDWYLDSSLGGVCNHISRPHMPTDLHRYLYVAAYARVHGRSPELNDFPADLHPAHRNLREALSKGYFDDRFRVQVSSRPSTTITSHIAKDGHYFIHYDEAQCRSLTVREAARLQTFPDNYYFCGPRTHQYRQVGNAVPPLLARQVAELVLRILTDDRQTVYRRVAAHG